MFRFSLTALLGLVSFAALGCAALANATDLWRECMVTLMLGLLLTATLAAIIWRGERRALATGFAVFGWAYMLLAFVSALGVRGDLLTDRLIARLYEVAQGSDQQQIEKNYIDEVITLSGAGRVIFGAGSNLRVWDVTTGRPAAGNNVPSYENFADIGHSLWATVIACLGAMVASLLSAGQRRPVEPISVPD